MKGIVYWDPLHPHPQASVSPPLVPGVGGSQFGRGDRPTDTVVLYSRYIPVCILLLKCISKARHRNHLCLYRNCAVPVAHSGGFSLLSSVSQIFFGRVYFCCCFILLDGAQHTDLRTTQQQKIHERNKQHCWIFDYTFYIHSNPTSEKIEI